MKVNLLQGRFQPFTLGHMKCVEAAAAKGIPTVIAQIETKSADKKHPFTDDMLEKPMRDLVKDIKDILDIIKVKNADIVKIGEEFAKHGYEIASWTCGTDRIDPYSKMATKYHDQAGLTDDFQMIEIKRGDEDISATKVRNACLGGDESTFKKLTPTCMHKYYKMFQDQLKKINEHKMKSLSEYINENINENLWDDAMTAKYGVRMHGEEREAWDALKAPKIVKVNGVKCHQLSNGTKLVVKDEVIHKDEYASIKTQLATEVAKFLKDNPGFRLAKLADLNGITTEEVLAVDKAEMDPEYRENPASMLMVRFCAAGDKITSQKYGMIWLQSHFLEHGWKPNISDIAARNYARICVVADEQ